MKQTAFKLLPVVVASLLASGCSSLKYVQTVATTNSMVNERADSETDRAANRLRPNSKMQEAAQDVSTPWLAGKSVPLAKEVSLPSILRRTVKVSELDRNCVTSLTAISVCLSRDLGIPFRVTPDALLPIANFAQRRGAGVAVGFQASTQATPTGPAAAQSGAANNGIPPVAAGTAIRPIAAVAGAPQFPLPIEDMPLARLMDLIQSHYSVNSRVTDNGQVEFFRLETRVLRLRALAQKVTNAVTVTTGFETTSKTTFENTAQDALRNMSASLLSLGTQAGDLTINPETKSVIVTDTPEAISRIEAYLDSENKRLNRRITVLMEEIIVTSSKNNESGIDWNLIYSKANSALNSRSLFSSPAPVTGANSGSMSVGLTGFGPLAGSALVVKALNQLGLTSTVRSFPLTTMNGSAVSIGIPTIFDYVAQVQTSTVTSGSGTVSAPSIQQKEEKVGAYFTVTPESQEDGTVILSYTLQDRSGTINPYTVNVNGSGTTIQQRNIQEVNLAQRTVVRMGVPHLVGGLDERTDNSNTRRLDENAPILAGGSNVVAQNARRVLMLVTAYAEEGI